MHRIRELDFKSTQSQFFVYFHVNCLKTSINTRIEKIICRQVLKKHLIVAHIFPLLGSIILKLLITQTVSNKTDN